MANANQTGIIQGREAFMSNVARRLGRGEPLKAPPERQHVGAPEHYRAIRLNQDENVRLFMQNWTALSGKVLVVREQEAEPAVKAFLLEAVRELEVNRITRWEHDGLIALNLDDWLADQGIAVVPWRQDADEAPAASLSSNASEALGSPAALSALTSNALAASTGALEPAAAKAELPETPFAGDSKLLNSKASQALEQAAAEAGPTRWSRRSGLLQAAERCQMGIVWPDYAIANTGTLALAAHGGRGRSVSLLPSILFAVFRADQLRTRMGEVFAELDPDEMASSFNLITGPSRSADIENDLTIGIHGPGKVYAVIIE